MNYNKTKSLLDVTFKDVKGVQDVPGLLWLWMKQLTILLQNVLQWSSSLTLSLNLRERGDTKSLFTSTGVVLKPYSFPLRKNRVD